MFITCAVNVKVHRYVRIKYDSSAIHTGFDQEIFNKFENPFGWVMRHLFCSSVFSALFQCSSIGGHKTKLSVQNQRLSASGDLAVSQLVSRKHLFLQHLL